jgi:hypothetical protein
LLALALALPLALTCDDPGSTAAIAPDAAALAMPMPAVIAVSRRSPRDVNNNQPRFSGKIIL